MCNGSNGQYRGEIIKVLLKFEEGSKNFTVMISYTIKSKYKAYYQ